MEKFIHGDLEAVKRFWKKVSVNERSGCWEWTACTNENSYGIFNAAGTPGRLAHRIAYYWTHGQISTILTIDHLCFNRKCVNPDHLEECSLIENSMRGNGWGAKNKRKTLCPRGHELVKGNLIESAISWGRRECKICHNALVAKRYENPDPNRQTSNTERTHCRHGHLLSEDNIVKSSIKFGTRQCLTCHTLHMKQDREKRKNGTIKKKLNKNSAEWPRRACLICYRASNRKCDLKKKELRSIFHTENE